MSSDLQWLLLRKNSSFLIKRNGSEFTTEPHNLTSLNQYKFSGLANSKALSVSTNAKGQIEVSNRSTRFPASLVSKNLSSSRVTIKRGNRRAARYIKNLTVGCHYRPDLTKAALGRMSRLVASKKAPKPFKAKKLRGKKALKQ